MGRAFSYVSLHLSTIFEFLAFCSVAGFVAHFLDVWWALVPAAVYLFFLSWVLDRGKR